MATNNSVNSPLSGTTGTGNFVGSTSPSLTTPVLGVPTSGTLTTCTGLPISTGVSGLGTGVSAFLGTPSSANLATALTDETGSGVCVFGTTPTISQPNIVGTTTNNNAAALSVGEEIESIIAASPGVSLSNATPANVTSISLTAGDWDVWGNVGFPGNGATTIGATLGWTSTTSATVPDLSLYTGDSATVGSPAASRGQCVPGRRFSLSGTTTVFLSCQASFSGGTQVACGGIYARRRR